MALDKNLFSVPKPVMTFPLVYVTRCATLHSVHLISSAQLAVPEDMDS